MPVRGIEDELYVVTALDDYSGYAETILTRTKAEAASGLVDLLVRWQRTTGRKLKILRTDRGTEFLGVLSDYCTRKGITRQLSTAYTPEQNGRAERLNRIFFLIYTLYTARSLNALELSVSSTAFRRLYGARPLPPPRIFTIASSQVLTRPPLTSYSSG